MIEYCPWCGRSRKSPKDSWEQGPAEIPANSKYKICNNCFRKEYKDKVA